MRETQDPDASARIAKAFGRPTAPDDEASDRIDKTFGRPTIQDAEAAKRVAEWMSAAPPAHKYGPPSWLWGIFAVASTGVIIASEWPQLRALVDHHLSAPAMSSAGSPQPSQAAEPSPPQVAERSLPQAQRSPPQAAEPSPPQLAERSPPQVGPGVVDSIELSCAAPAVFVGDATPGANPVVGVSVWIKNRQWKIQYTFASGKHVNREDQYSLSDESTDSSTVWTGSLLSNPRFRMTGDILLYRATDRFFYRERIRDESKGGRIVVSMVASCYRADQPPIVADAPSTDASPPPSAYSSGSDSVPIYTGAHGSAAYVDVGIGTRTVRMLIDTGATNVSVIRSIAAALIANHEAVLLPVTAPIKIADGSTILEQIISIRTLTIGRHTLHHVIAGVAPDGADMLLGFPVLNQVGRFTIDTANGQLIFG
jgi:clan AA aspartic protease (TIGR02281 family)